MSNESCYICENVRYRYSGGLFIPCCPLKEGKYLESLYAVCPFKDVGMKVK